MPAPNITPVPIATALGSVRLSDPSLSPASY